MSLAPDQAADPQRRSRWRDRGFLASAAAALALGAYLGREAAYYASIGGESILGVGFLIGLAILGVIIAAIGWPILARLLGRSAWRALGSVGVAAAVMTVGMLGGAATARITGGTSHPPVYLQASARIQATLSGTGLDMARVDGTMGHCDSEPDSREIASVEALDLGSFGTGRLRGLLVFNPDGSVDGWAMIDGSDSNPEALPIRWAGTLRVMSMSPDRSSGDVFFPDVHLGVDSKLPDATIGPEWPRSMSGDISWECQPFEG
jgi:hypothetical protein